MLRPVTDEIAIIIASLKRPEELGRWVDHVERQTLKPIEMVWAVTGAGDVPADAKSDPSVPLTIIHSPIGSAAQRNTGLDALRSQPTIVAFFDDDYVPTTTCLEDIVHAFRALPDVIGLTGTLLADGINSAGIEYEAACSLIDLFERSRPPRGGAVSFRPSEGLYGCNMAIRIDDQSEVRFDERLPLYAWQEDIDFANRYADGRKLGQTDGFVGVHQGVKRGRTSGKRFGYSQIANPIYLFRKGSMSRGKMFSLVSKNVLANHAKCLRPEPWVDRFGRMRGNWLGIADLVRGRIDPERILKL